MRALALVATTLWLSTGRALAHDAARVDNRAVWTFDPWIWTLLLVFGVLYAVGFLALRQRGSQQRARNWQAGLAVGGWLSLAGSLVSPLHWLGEHLFTFHMIEHEIIMAVSAPLLVIANPVGPLLWSLPRRIRLTTGRFMRHTKVLATWRWFTDGTLATILHGVAIWAWHAPALFDATIGNIMIHRLQHLSFFLTAVLFWWSALRRNEPGLAAWHVFITMLHTSVLGALMTLSPRVVYVAQTHTASAWGLTPLEDQQLAGVIMWVPAGTVYAGAALALTAIWIKQTSEKARQTDAACAI